MKTSEMIKKLKEAGCIIIRHGGNHDVWRSPKTGKDFTVWRHSKEIPTGTANKIMKDAGLK